MPITNHVVKLDEAQIKKLEGLLIARGWEMADLNHAHYRAKKDKTTIAAYKSGKVSIQGKGTEELVQFLIEPEITGQVQLGYENELKTAQIEEETPEQFSPHAGIDESGKGDYFGPLVVACAYTDEASARKLIDLGVQDSKNIKSDKKAKELAQKIKGILYGKYTIVTVGPEAYNRLYLKTRNLNSLLGWGHARVLEDLLEKVPNCQMAISDKFSKTGSVDKALMERGQKIELIQRTKAESDIAVAAASILARAEFLERLDKLSQEAELTLPKGASQLVLDIAVQLIQNKGEDQLKNFAKLHFKTTDKAQELAKHS